MSALLSFSGVQGGNIKPADLTVGGSVVGITTELGPVSNPIKLSTPNDTTSSFRVIFSGLPIRTSGGSGLSDLKFQLSDAVNGILYSFNTTAVGGPIIGKIDFIWNPGTAFYGVGTATGSGFFYIGSVLNTDGSISNISGFFPIISPSPSSMKLTITVSTVSGASSGNAFVVMDKMELVEI